MLEQKQVVILDSSILSSPSSNLSSVANFTYKFYLEFTSITPTTTAMGQGVIRSSQDPSNSLLTVFCPVSLKSILCSKTWVLLLKSQPDHITSCLKSLTKSCCTEHKPKLLVRSSMTSSLHSVCIQPGRLSYGTGAELPISFPPQALCFLLPLLFHTPPLSYQ